MKRYLLLIALLGLGCSGTTLAANATATIMQPSATLPAATDTPQPTVTELPTATQPPTATPLPPVISAQNAAQVDRLGEMGVASLRKVVFSPDGETFATGEGNEADFGVDIWQAPGGDLRQSMTGFSGIVWDLAYSPDGQRIVTAADDQGGQHLRIWDAADGRELITVDGPPTTSSLAFSPDGARLAVGGLSGWPQGVIWVYDTTTWKMVQLLIAPGQNVTALLFNRDGSRLISSGTDGNIRVWSMPDGTQLNKVSAGRQANRLALSPDDSLLASNFCTKTDSSGCIQGGVAIWKTSNWTTIQKFEDIAESLAFSPDGSLLVSGSGQNDPLVRIRQAGDWALLRTLPGEAFSVAFSPDSRLLVSTQWNKIVIWGLH